MNSEKPRCCRVTLFTGSGRLMPSDRIQCTSAAKVQRNGLWFCNAHDPDKEDARRRRSQDRMRARFAVRDAVCALTAAQMSFADEVLAAWDDGCVVDFPTKELQRRFDALREARRGHAEAVQAAMAKEKV